MVARFDKNSIGIPEKRTDNPKEESITENLFEEPGIKETKRTLSQTTVKRKLSLRNLKKTQSLRKIKRNTITESHKEETIRDGHKEDRISKKFKKRRNR